MLRRLAPPHVRIKASGGIKTAGHVLELLHAGADLVGTSSGVQIMNDLANPQSVSAESSSSY